jgi:hypothetical protein
VGVVARLVAGGALAAAAVAALNRRSRMRVTLESTDKIVDLVTASGTVRARIWEGVTAEGIACHAFITRIAVSKDDDAAAFERDLHETRPVSSAIAGVYDARLVL